MADIVVVAVAADYVVGVVDVVGVAVAAVDGLVVLVVGDVVDVIVAAVTGVAVVADVDAEAAGEKWWGSG